MIIAPHLGGRVYEQEWQSHCIFSFFTTFLYGGFVILEVMAYNVFVSPKGEQRLRHVGIDLFIPDFDLFRAPKS